MVHSILVLFLLKILDHVSSTQPSLYSKKPNENTVTTSEINLFPYQGKIDKNGVIKWPEIEETSSPKGLSKQSQIVFQLADPVRNFGGRKMEQNILRNMQEDRKFIVISGESGVGKSELARKYAELFRNETGGNVVWIRATSVTDTVEDFQKLAHKLRIAWNGKISGLIREICLRFVGEKSLLIFDDAKTDNVVLKHLRMYLPIFDDIKVLVTSRERLWNLKHFSLLEIEKFGNEEPIQFLKTSHVDGDLIDAFFKIPYENQDKVLDYRKHFYNEQDMLKMKERLARRHPEYNPTSDMPPKYTEKKLSIEKMQMLWPWMKNLMEHTKIPEENSIRQEFTIWNID